VSADISAEGRDVYERLARAIRQIDRLEAERGEDVSAALEAAARSADAITNRRPGACACPPESQRECGYREGANAVAQLLHRLAREERRTEVCR
jgi:hypothetical protein